MLVLNHKGMDKRLQKLPTGVLSLLAQIEEYKGQWIAGAKLDPQLLGRLKQSVLITSAGASTRIEGARLSDADVEKLMGGLMVKRFADRDAQEVRGYYELLEHVFGSWKTQKFSESLIKHFHKELLRYVEKDARHRGEYKKVGNKVVMLNAAGKAVGVVFETTPPYLTPKAMQELVDWAKKALATKRYHPLLTIGAFLVEFLRIHPFQDGNGRLSRILTNVLLLQAGYAHVPYVSHEKIVEDRKSDYYLALRRSQRTFGTTRENIAPWMIFFFNIVLEQSRRALTLLTGEQIEKILSPKQAEVWQYLAKTGEATPGEIARATKIARPTINQALTKLLRLKRIERFGLGRATRYRRR